MVRLLNRYKNCAAILTCAIVLGILAPVAAAAPVKVEAIGFFGHPPLFKERDAIKQVCQDFGDKVELSLYIEESPDGVKFMKEKGLSGHLPVVIYVNGSVAHKIGDRVIVFRDFIGEGWTKADLQQVIKLNVEGQKTAVDPPANATTTAWNAKAFASGSASQASTTYPIVYYLGGAILIAGGALVWWRSRSRKK